MTRSIDHAASYTIFVVSRADSAAFKAVVSLDAQISDSRAYAVVSPEDNIGQPADPVANFFPAVSSGGRQALFAWMTTHSPDVQCVRIATIQSQKLSPETQKSLLSTATWLQERCNTYAPNTLVRPIRVALFCEGEVAESRSLLVDGAALNLVVVPRDSRTHTGMAQPITLAQDSLLVSHLQIELATLFGLWRETTSCLVDSYPAVVSGDGKVWLRFVGSRALVLDCPPLPIASVVDDDEYLSTPVDCEAFPGSTDKISKIIGMIYPADLRFHPTDPPTGTISTNAKSFWREYLSEFGGVILRLPKLLVKDLQGELNRLSVDILQEVVGGDNSKIRILFANQGHGEVAVEISDEQIELIISRVIAETDTPPRLALEARHWNQLVQKTLSFVDGSEVAARDREAIAQENWLVVEKNVLSPVADELTETIQEFECSLGLNEHVVAGLPESVVAAVVVPAAESRNTEPDLVMTSQTDAVLSEPIFADSSAEQSVLAPPRLEDAVSLVQDTAETLLPVLPAAVDEQLSRPINILTGLAAEFAGEAEKAGRNVKAMADRLRNMPHEFAARDAAVISRTIRFALFLGLAVTYLTTGVFSDRRKWLSGEFFTEYTRDFLWAFAATLIICLSIAGLLVKTTGRWQLRVIAAVSICITTISLEWVFFGPIRDFVLRVRPLRTTALVGGLVMAATIAITLVSYMRNRLSGNVVRRQFASILLAALSIFCLVGVTAYLGNDRSPVRNLSDGTQLRLMIIGYVLAGSLLVAGAAVYAFVVLRERYRLKLLADILKWAETELLESALADRDLRRAAVQWIGTASVIARLIRYPLGRETHRVADLVESAKRFDPNLMKFDQATLRLTDRGQHGLASRLRTLFIRRGWLTSQYRHLVKTFQQDWAFSKGLSEEDSRRVHPELCPVAPEWSDVVSDSVKGSRWQFMKSVFAGKYDESLLVQSSDVRLEDAYATILSDRAAHSVGDSRDLDCVSFFNRLVPSEVKLLDGGLVTTIFGGNDPRQRMKTHVWWPRDLVRLEPEQFASGGVAEVQYSEVLTPDRISSATRLFGSCVSVSELFSIDEISVTGQVN